MQRHTNRIQLLLITFILPGCTENLGETGESFEAAQATAEIEYIDKSTAAKALEDNDGIAITPTGEEITLHADNLCDSPQAHVRIPEGFKAVPNDAGDGFRVVPEAEDDLISFRKYASITCSGCTTGCSPYANEINAGCTSGCSPCKLEF